MRNRRGQHRTRNHRSAAHPNGQHQTGRHRNAAHPNEKVTFKQQSASADDQLQDLQQHFQSKDAGYDVVAVDVVWTAQLAAQGWLVPLKGDFALDTSKLLPATVKAAVALSTTRFALPT